MNTKLSDTRGVYRRFYGHIKPYRPILLIGVIATICYSLIDAGFVYLMKDMLDKGFIERDEVFIQYAPYIILVAFMLRGVMSFGSQYSFTWIARSIVMSMRAKLFKKYLHLPAKFYDGSTTGQLLSKLLYDIEQVAQLSMDAIANFLQSLFLVLGLFAFMLYISWKLTLIFVLVIPIIALVVKKSNHRVRRASTEVQNKMELVTQIAEEAIKGYRTVRLHQANRYETQKFHRALHESRRGDLKVALTRSINVSTVQIIAACCIAYVVSLAMSPNSSHMLTAGAFSSLIAAMLAMLKPLKNLTSIGSIMQRGLAGAISVFNTIDLEDESDQGHATLSNVQGEITFDRVDLSYDTKPNVLKQVSFSIKPGQFVALVGESGSGKSTIADLIPRFYDSTNGAIYLDGIQINDLSLANLREHISFVSQHVVLFNDTIAKNIAYGYEVDMERLKKAAIAATADEFISELPDGYQTVIGENGAMLSGGQRQRLSIARALYKNAPILVLDEATSSLDSATEQKVHEAIRTYAKGKTIISIVHKLTSITLADNILVMEDGQLIEQGNHNSLMDTQGRYHSLYQLQNKAFSTDNQESAA